MLENRLLGIAIPASWNVMQRPWRTTFAPILNSFSRSVSNFRFGSKADERGHRHKGPLLGVKQTESARKRTLTPERPLLGVERTYRQHGRRVRC